MPSRIRSLASHPALLCALALGLCVLATHPVLEMGLNDDWSYIWSARVLAQTGRITYNGWASPMLTWQLFLGALFIKLFGFSFTIARVPILLLSMGCVALLQRLFVRFGISEWNATVATLTIALSPVFMPLTFCFMTDVPGFLCLVVCLYQCVRALQARTDRAACAWIVFAALANALDGTVRQIAWLGVLVMVPSTIWCLRRRRVVLLAGLASCAIAALIILACTIWFSHQPYAAVEKPLAMKATLHELPLQMHLILKEFLALLLFLVPILVAFFRKLPWKSMQATVAAAIVAAGLLLAFAFQLRMGFHGLIPISPLIGNTAGPKGSFDFPTILGERPEMLPGQIRFALGILALAASSAWLIWRFSASPPAPVELQSRPGLSTRETAYLLGPFTLAYTLLLATRFSMYDRYMLALLVVGLIVIVRSYQQHYNARLPLECSVVLLVFTAFGVASMHDNFAMDRARVAAADELRSAGIPRSDIRAGFEYDQWTQLELKGYVNEERIKIPVGAYREPEPPTIPPLCRVQFWQWTTAFVGRYRLSFNPLPCAGPTQFPTVTYQSWLPARRNQILILKLNQ